MKKFIFVAVAALLALNAEARVARVETKSVKAYPELRLLVNKLLPAIAAGGSSLEAFDFEENLDREMPKRNCSKVPARTVLREFAQGIKTVLEAGEKSEVDPNELKMALKKGLPQFKQLIGQSDYVRCENVITENRTYGQKAYYFGPDYSFSTELGWED